MINLTYYIGDYHIYTGKILGMIDRNQFYNLYHGDAKIARKVGSCPIKTLQDLVDSREHKNCRLVFSTTNEKQIRKILVTAEIEKLTQSTAGNKISEVTLLDINADFLHLEADGNT